MNRSRGSAAVGLSIRGNNYIMHISDDLPHNSRRARITYRWDDALTRIHSLYLHQDFLLRLALKNKLQDKGRGEVWSASFRDTSLKKYGKRSIHTSARKGFVSGGRCPMKMSNVGVLWEVDGPDYITRLQSSCKSPN